jgi:DNA-directed RNA polymerase omega subunit
MSLSSRYTSEDAVAKVGNNRFNLVLIASLRARELKNGSPAKVPNQGMQATGPMLTALREIEGGHVGVEYLDMYRDTEKQRKKNLERYDREF